MALNLSNYVDVAQRLRMMHERWPDLRLQESPPPGSDSGPLASAGTGKGRLAGQ